MLFFLWHSPIGFPARIFSSLTHAHRITSSQSPNMQHTPHPHIQHRLHKSPFFFFSFPFISLRISFLLVFYFSWTLSSLPPFPKKHCREHSIQGKHPEAFRETILFEAFGGKALGSTRKHSEAFGGKHLGGKHSEAIQETLGKHSETFGKTLGETFSSSSQTCANTREHSQNISKHSDIFRRIQRHSEAFRGIWKPSTNTHKQKGRAKKPRANSARAHLQVRAHKSKHLGNIHRALTDTGEALHRHWGNTGEAYANTRGKTLGNTRKKLENSQKHLGNIRETLGNIQETFRKHSKTLRTQRGAERSKGEQRGSSFSLKCWVSAFSLGFTVPGFSANRT